MKLTFLNNRPLSATKTLTTRPPAHPRVVIAFDLIRFEMVSRILPEYSTELSKLKCKIHEYSLVKLRGREYTITKFVPKKYLGPTPQILLIRNHVLYGITESDQRISIHVQISGIHTRTVSFAELQEGTEHLMNGFYTTADYEKLLQVDIACDLLGVRTYEIYDLVDKGHCRSTFKLQSRKLTKDGGKNCYVHIGTGEDNSVSVRIYNKLKDLKRRSRSTLADTIEYLYGGIQLWVTRVEFRLKYNYLKRFDVSTIAEFTKALPSIVEDLTSNVLRLTTHPVKGNHRTPTHPIWIALTMHIKSWALSGFEHTWSKPIEPDLDTKAANCELSGIGLLLNACLYRNGKYPDKIAKFIDYLLSGALRERIGGALSRKLGHDDIH